MARPPPMNRYGQPAFVAESASSSDVVAQRYTARVVSTRSPSAAVRWLVRPKAQHRIVVERSPFGSVSSESWVIERRYSDFVRFRNELLRTQPRASLPPLPPKLVRHSDARLAERQSQLNRFMHSLIRGSQSQHAAVLRFLAPPQESIHSTSTAPTRQDGATPSLSLLEPPVRDLVDDSGSGQAMTDELNDSNAGSADACGDGTSSGAPEPPAPEPPAPEPPAPEPPAPEPPAPEPPAPEPPSRPVEHTGDTRARVPIRLPPANLGLFKPVDELWLELSLLMVPLTLLMMGATVLVCSLTSLVLRLLLELSRVLLSSCIATCSLAIAVAEIGARMIGVQLILPDAESDRLDSEWLPSSLSTSLSTSLRDTPLGERRECERCHCFEIFVRQGVSDNRTVAIGQCDRLYVLAAPLTRES